MTWHFRLALSPSCGGTLIAGLVISGRTPQHSAPDGFLPSGALCCPDLFEPFEGVIEGNRGGSQGECPEYGPYRFLSTWEGSVVDPALSKDDFNRFVDRHDHQHAELDGRIARDMVPMPMYVADQRAMERRFAELERDLAEQGTRHERELAEVKAAKADNTRVSHLAERVTTVEARPAHMRSYLLALAGLALTLLGIVVSAYFAARGAS